MGQRINIYGIGPLLSLLGDVNSLLGGDQFDELVTVLADNDGPGVAGHVMPGYSVVVFVIEDNQAGLVVELLQSLDGDADVVLCIDWTFLDSLVVIWLRLAFPR